MQLQSYRYALEDPERVHNYSPNMMQISSMTTIHYKQSTQSTVLKPINDVITDVTGLII